MSNHLILTHARIGMRVTVRTIAVTAALSLLAGALGVLALTLGEAGISVSQALRVLLGQESGLTETIVLEWRLPRVAAALVFGAALGASGAIFQSLTRNPLGSPDIIGFNTGAYSGALIVTLGFGASYSLVAFGSLAGGLITALVVYLLARKGGASGLRLIIVGLGISAMLSALNRWLILNGELEAAMAAAVWGAGTLNGVRWPQVGTAVILLLALLLLAVLLTRQIEVLDLGDDAAAGLGAAVGRVRLVLLIVGVGLTAGVTAVAGPIAFVALAAPQLAARLTRSPGLPILPAAAMGALVLMAADLVAQHAFAPIQLPVGVMTVVVGGCYLIYLLTRESRS